MKDEQVIKSVEDYIAEPEGDIEIVAEEKVSRIPPPISKELRSKAFELYMSHVSYDDISTQTGIKKGTLLSWSGREGWSRKREDNDKVILGEMFETKKFKLDALVESILDGAIRTIANEAKSGFKVKDLPVMLAALSSVEKLSRLTHGKATSISEERSKRAQFTLPLEHLKNAQQIQINDPFATPAAPKQIKIEDEPDEPRDSPADS